MLSHEPSARPEVSDLLQLPSVKLRVQNKLPVHFQDRPRPITIQMPPDEALVSTQMGQDWICQIQRFAKYDPNNLAATVSGVLALARAQVDNKHHKAHGKKKGDKLSVTAPKPSTKKEPMDKHSVTLPAIKSKGDAKGAKGPKPGKSKIAFAAHETDEPPLHAPKKPGKLAALHSGSTAEVVSGKKRDKKVKGAKTRKNSL